ncbi:MAG: cobalamin-dependent protein, partial [Phycisphaerales bacterium]|nr:cobalamin-dependent protein [Phycisphaerales bacterium]
MRVKFILAALEEALSPFWRPIKYSLFPPLGLATLAACCRADDDVELIDEHIETVALEDEPELVVLQVYITNAYRAYEIADHYRAKGVFVAMGGLHPTALPEEAALHADAVFTGPGEDTFARFLEVFRNGGASAAKGRYDEVELRPHNDLLPRRDLIRRDRYLVPNSLVVSRGCPHRCDFCYADGFYRGRKRFVVHAIDRVLREIDAMPGRHLYFLDDHLFASPYFAGELFGALRGMRRVFQGATTVDAVLERPELLEAARDAGYRSA